MLKLKSSARDEIYTHAIETFPEECCGLMSSSSLDGIVTKVYRCRKIQNKLHNEDPEVYPRTAQTAYNIDPIEQLRIEGTINKQRSMLAGIYHSHPNKESYLSEEDRKRALWDNVPIIPNAHYIVVSIIDKEIHDIKSFTWDPEKKDFIEEKIEIFNSQY